MKQGMNLGQMAETLKEIQENKHDYLTDTRNMRMNVAGNDIEIDINGVGQFVPNRVMHGQIATKVGIPKRYYDRMMATAPHLLYSNVNHWLKEESEARMVRTVGSVGRAFLSKSYRPLDNYDLADVVIPELNKAGCEIRSSAVTDTRFYIKATSPRKTAEVKVGDIVEAGVMVSNSEVGHGALLISPLVMRLSCLNGMVVNDARMRKYHTGKAFQGDDEARELFEDETRQVSDKALFMQVRDLVQASLEGSVFATAVEKMKVAAGCPIEGDIPKAVEVFAQDSKLSDDDRSGILNHLIRENDLSCWGLSNAVTRHSQDVEDYDRATELEVLGGKVIEMPQTAIWRKIAMAG